ncbi:hypothetical protein SAMN05192539_1013117 [Paraburkholderia diazotrophica]|uniref:Uncharacterized protein n=1 Tax=Paraburkholderia diazotrophica TaxID=667676 RepID=A0A1H7A756_9BURK|nr:hypothetical protein SAMN05192539_1013117 [Paraburkholderia diazotrophica]
MSRFGPALVFAGWIILTAVNIGLALAVSFSGAV